MTWKALQLGAGRVISLVRFLVLARLLAPDDFGLLAIATVALDLLLTITNFGMIPALIQRQDPEERHYHAAWTVQVVRGACIAAVVITAAPLIAGLFGDPRATGLIRLIALRPLLSAFVSIRVADLERNLDFRRLALIEVPAGVLQTVAAIALVPVLGVYAIIAGMLVGAALHVAMSYVLAPYRPRVTLAREASAPLFRYGRWILATSLVGVLGDAAPRVVISRQLGTVELGLYYLAARLVALPNGVISVIIGSVSFPLHARLQEQRERAVAAFQANVTALFASLIPVYVGLIALAPALVRDVLGERWEGSVGALRILALGPMLGIVIDAVVPLLQGRGRPQGITAMMVIRSIVLLAVAWPLATAFGLPGAAAAIVLAEIPTQLMAAWLARRQLPGAFRGLQRPFAAALGASVSGGAAAWGADALLGPPLGLVAGVLSGAVVGIGLLAVLDRMVGVGLFAQLVRAFPPVEQRERAGALCPVPVVGPTSPAGDGERDRRHLELAEHRDAMLQEVGVAVVEGHQDGASRQAPLSGEMAADLCRLDETPAGIAQLGQLAPQHRRWDAVGGEDRVVVQVGDGVVAEHPEAAGLGHPACLGDSPPIADLAQGEERPPHRPGAGSAVDEAADYRCGKPDEGGRDPRRHEDGAPHGAVDGRAGTPAVEELPSDGRVLARQHDVGPARLPVLAQVLGGGDDVALPGDRVGVGDHAVTGCQQPMAQVDVLVAVAAVGAEALVEPVEGCQHVAANGELPRDDLVEAGDPNRSPRRA